MADIQKLIQKLQSPKSSVRYDACEELRVAPSITPNAMKALEIALNDPDPYVAEAAQNAINIHLIPDPEPSIASIYSGMIQAKKLLIQPSILEDYVGKYLIIYDVSLNAILFDNLNRAICLAAEYGWKALNITSHFNPIEGLLGERRGVMYVLLERMSIT